MKTKSMKYLYSKNATRTRRYKGKRNALGLSFEALEDRRMLAAVTVSTAADLVDGNTASIASLIANPGVDGAVSLREALAAADNSSTTDTITFDANVFNGDSDDVIRLQSQLSVEQSVEINGGDLGIVVSGDSSGDDALVPGSFVTDVDASELAGVLSDNNRVFEFNGGSRQFVTISGLTITGGDSFASGGAILAAGSNLTLSQSIVAGNRAFDSGGGIEISGGQLTIDQSTVSGNVVESFNGSGTGLGGGIAASISDVVISSSTISGNVASGERGQGGGVYSDSGSLTLISSTVSGNVATNGNGVSAGGGIFLGSQSSLINDSTITKNTANFGGGILISSSFSAVTLDLDNSIVANNVALSASADIATGSSVAIDANHSLVGDRSGTSLAPTSGTADSSGNLIGTSTAPIDPGLASLADNGGLTKTHRLLPTSPAINAGSSSFALDQRGGNECSEVMLTLVLSSCKRYF